MKRILFAVIALSGVLTSLAQDTMDKEKPDTLRIGGMIIIKKEKMMTTTKKEAATSLFPTATNENHPM